MAAWVGGGVRRDGLGGSPGCAGIEAERCVRSSWRYRSCRYSDRHKIENRKENKRLTSHRRVQVSVPSSYNNVGGGTTEVHPKHAKTSPSTSVLLVVSCYTKCAIKPTTTSYPSQVMGGSWTLLSAGAALRLPSCSKIKHA